MRTTVAVLLFVGFSASALRADDCDGRVKRHFIIAPLPDQSNVEVGYTWSFNGTLGICGQCGFANAPGGPSSPGNPFTVIMDWGDGSSSALAVAVGGTTSATHQYTHPSSPVASPGPPFKPVASGKAYCIAGWGQGWEYVASNGGFWTETHYGQAYGVDFAAAPAINVYPASKPTTIVVDTPLAHGVIATEAMTIILQRPAPPSGTALKISSSDARVKIISRHMVTLAAQDKKDLIALQSIVFVMPPTDTSAAFDVDTKAAPAGLKVTFTVANVATDGGSATRVITLQ